MTAEEYNQKQAEQLARVPDEFRGVLSWMAYEQGHADGDGEVLNILCALVNDLEPAITRYTARIGGYK